MAAPIKKPFKLSKLIRKTIFYMFIATLSTAIILPVFFLVSLSFLSTREAYQYPLPLLPSLKTEYSLTHGNRGYLISVYDNFDKEYQTVLDTSELDKISVYMKNQLGTPYSIPEIEGQIAKLESGLKIQSISVPAKISSSITFHSFKYPGTLYQLCCAVSRSLDLLSWFL